MTFFRIFADRLKEGLLGSQRALKEGLDRLLSAGRPFDEALFEELEELLVGADLGAATAGEFVSRVREDVGRGRLTVPEDIRVLLRRHLMEALAESASPLSFPCRPTVILILGVNGSGKTTTAGKIAHALKAEGKSVLLAAADTFRAAAIEQLQVWGKRAGAEVICQAAGADPSAVVWDAVKAATARQVDVLIVDTAGRLHTKAPLMEELAKVKRVVSRQLPGGPHESLMVLDAPTGQNGLVQAKLFHEGVGLTGLVLTKLDGTAKGGVVVRIHRELGLPIKFVGVGERIEDLQPFDSKAFVSALIAE